MFLSNNNSNNKYHNNNPSSNGTTLLLFMLLLASCIMMGLMVESTTASCSSGGCSSSTSLTSNSTTNTTTTTSYVQLHWEKMDEEILELTCLQQRLSSALSILKINTTLNGEIIFKRTKQMDRITNALSLLTQESSFLKLVTYSLSSRGNGQAFEFGDGSRAKSCRDYRNPIKPYKYSGEGSGLYKIEPTLGLVLTVYCDMTTDGGGWTLVSGIRNDYAGVHFHTFEDSTAISSSNVTSFHLKTSALLSLSTQVRAAHDTGANPMTTFYQSSWSHSAYCNLTQALRDAIQITPTINNGDLATNCAVLSGTFSTIPTHFTYGKTGNGHSIGFRMGVIYPGFSGSLLDGKSYGTYSYTGAPEGTIGNTPGTYTTFSGNGEHNRNGAVFLR